MLILWTLLFSFNFMFGIDNARRGSFACGINFAAAFLCLLKLIEELGLITI